MKYSVQIREILVKKVAVEADNEDEAERIWDAIAEERQELS